MYVKEKVEEKKVEESRWFRDFRQRKQGAFCERRLETDLRKSQRSCEQLDSAKVCTTHTLIHLYATCSTV